METGGGKYVDLCTYVREQAKADAAIVLVMNGKRGTGFSVQAPAGILALLPDLLVTLAEDIRAERERAEREGAR